MKVLPLAYNNYLLIVFLFSLIFPFSIAAKTSPVNVLQQTLQIEQSSLEKLKSEVENLKKTQQKELSQILSKKLNESDVAQAQLTLDFAQVKSQSIQLDQTSIQNQIVKLQSHIKQLQQQINSAEKPSHSKKVSASDDSITQLKALQLQLGLKQKQLKLLNQLSDFQLQKVKLLQVWLNTLQKIIKQQQSALRLESLADLEQKFQLEIQKKQALIDQLQHQLADIPSTPNTGERREQLTQRINFLNESINLINSKLKLAAQNAELQTIDTAHLDKSSTDKLKQWLTTIDDIKHQIKPSIIFNEGNTKVLEQQLNLLDRRYRLQEISETAYLDQKAHLQTLIKEFQDQLLELKRMQESIINKFNALEKAYQSNLSRSLTIRQHLPSNPGVLYSVLLEIGHFPGLLLQTFIASWHDLYQQWHKADLRIYSQYFLLLFFLISIILVLNWLPSPVLGPMADYQSFTMKARDVFFALLRSSRSVIIFTGPLLITFWVFNIDLQHLVLLIALIWLALKWITQISYWLFVSPLVPVEQRQPNFHRNIIWVVSGLAFFTLLLGIGHFEFISNPMRELVERLFMLLLLPLVYLTLQLRNIIIQRIKTKSQNAFWSSLVSLLSLILPLTTLAVSIIGLTGYINLAWFVAEQLVLVVSIFIVWLILRHLLLDGIARLRLFAEALPEHSIFVLHALIKPLQLLSKFGLMVIMLWILIYCLSLSTGADIEGFIRTELNRPFMSIGKRAIAPLHLIQASLIAFFVIYFGILSRQLSYELFYRQIHDRGLRNSVSVFTQYIIIVIGLLLALNLLGINLTSLTMFAGALGVGIGFGLQNIANNFISGLILLTERPVRTEDWISIGSQNGRIKRIGMRSLVLTTWDNQDVIIPNADLITNPVTNWTLSDSLVRTVFDVGIRYQDDPHLAQKIIQEAVTMTPSVYLERPPQVLLTEFANSSVNFRIQFYSDVESQTSRLQVKSDVMFAIWDALRDAGIGIPFPQQDIYIKELPDSTTDNK